MLLGVDPSLPDGEGSDALTLADAHPPATTAALNLAKAIRRRSRAAAASAVKPAKRGDGGDGGDGGGSRGGDPGGTFAKRAPTAGSGVCGAEEGPRDLEKGGGCGDVGELGVWCGGLRGRTRPCRCVNNVG